MIRRIVVLVALVLSPALVACSSTDTKSSSPSPTETASGNSAEVSSLNLRFDLPEDWDPLSPDDVAGALPDSDSTIQDMADRMGVSIDQFRQMVEQAELWAFAPEVSGDFLDNVNVLDLGTGSVPDEAAARQQLSSIGAELATYESVTTAVGDGARYDYTLTSGALTVNGAALALGVDGRLVLITFSSTSATVSKQAVDLAIDTLEPTE